jgi:hypothetical protein
MTTNFSEPVYLKEVEGRKTEWFGKLLRLSDQEGEVSSK